jgi:hypothetical protein
MKVKTEKMPSTPNKIKALLGTFLLIHFDDHALRQDSSGSMESWTFGQVWRITPSFIVLRWWAANDDKEGANDEFVSIVRGAIRGIKRFE